MKYASNLLVFAVIFTGGFTYLSALVLDSNGVMGIYTVNILLWSLLMGMVAEDDQNVNNTQNIIK